MSCGRSAFPNEQGDGLSTYFKTGFPDETFVKIVGAHTSRSPMTSETNRAECPSRCGR